jgi:hypothetical protein
MSDSPASDALEHAASPPPVPGPLAARIFDANDGWLLVAAGICLAGGAYPVIVASMFASIGLVVQLFVLLRQPSLAMGIYPFTWIPVIVTYFAGAAALAGVGVIWAGFVTVIVVPIFYLFARSLQLRANIIWLGAICGGLVGFVAVLPFWLNASFRNGVDHEFLIAALVGPGLTTILGQVGGARGGLRAWREQRWPRDRDGTTQAEKVPLLRFQIRHLLWVTVWLSLLLTAIRLSGIPFELILPVLIAWLTYQAATLYCGWLIVRRLLPWWSARQARRST